MRDRDVFSENAIRRILCKLLPLSTAYDAATLEFVSAFRGTMMRPTDESPQRAGEQLLQHDAPGEGFERGALDLAKARQDRVHAALDVWITAVIAELASQR
jgi:hypothetical protein